MERFFNPEPAPAPAPAPAPTPAPARYRQGVASSGLRSGPAQAQPDAAASLLGAPPAGRGPERPESSAAVTGTLLATDVVQVGAELHVGCERQRPS